MGAAEGRGTPRRAPDVIPGTRAMAGSMPVAFSAALLPRTPPPGPTRLLWTEPMERRALRQKRHRGGTSRDRDSFAGAICAS